MSKIAELISASCPDGVPYKTLGELGVFYGGLTGKSRNDFKDGNAKFITYRNVYSNPALKIDVDDRVKIAEGEKQRTLQYGDVVFTGSSETPDECGISSVVTVETDEKLYLNSFCFFFRFNDLSIMLPDFAKHLFRSSELRYQIGKTASGVTRYNVSKKLMEKVTIPVPPLEVQREIVRILDNFTELTARKKQYEFYRDKLLTFDIASA
ncbi:MAG: restriction endonuclease subunit S, partial [Lachnospiraceae bacterium]|nr:restriction endonuclease subunit S [Lachnospiraceae bacterium]